uniref:Uncharacterized protein n=1 Tax=uncultured bacterium contig00094 TaxID=1181565 RepID=A0A806KRU5_9BACT|nr:hypothetical protein [uncultured bacterium contig00094]
METMAARFFAKKTPQMVNLPPKSSKFYTFVLFFLRYIL